MGKMTIGGLRVWTFAKIIFTEINTTHNTYYNHLIKYAKNTRSLKLRAYIIIDWFPAQINDYIKDT